MYLATMRAMPVAAMEAFVAAFREAAAPADVVASLGAATRWLGFDRFVLVERSGGQQRFCLSDFPTRWFDRRCAVVGADDDPVMLAGAQSIVPFWWHDLPPRVAVSDQHSHGTVAAAHDLPTLAAGPPDQHSHLAVAAAHGLTHGYSVPVHHPGGGFGLCSFVGDSAACRLDRPATAQYLACLAIDTVLRLTAGESADSRSAMERAAMRPTEASPTARTESASATAPCHPPRLTPRQLDCVVLAARGKSDWVTGRLLGLSSDTVHKYIENAKRRYGVSSRTELVVRALHDGQLSFSDVFARDNEPTANCRSSAAAT